MTKKRQKIEHLMTSFLRWKFKSSNKSDSQANKSGIGFTELAVFALLFIGIQIWQQRDMLDSNGSIGAPHFTLPSLNSGPVTYRADNNKATLFYFFAPWCSVCHVSIENLGTLKQQIEDNRIDVFIIALDYNGIDEVTEFVREHDLVTDVLLGGPQQRQDFQISAFPSYYIADSRGKIQWADRGYSASLGIKMRAELVLD